MFSLISLKVSVLRLALPHAFFSIISLKVSILRLADIQWQPHPPTQHTQQPGKQPTSVVAAVPLKAVHPLPPSSFCLSQKVNQSISNSSSFSKSFIYSGKQGGGATVGVGGVCDTITRETCFPSECKNLRKSSCATFCLLPLLWLGPVPNSACWLFDTAVLLSSSHRHLIIQSPQRPA
jgi:hypothetical protein